MEMMRRSLVSLIIIVVFALGATLGAGCASEDKTASTGDAEKSAELASGEVSEGVSGEAEHEAGPPESRQGAHDISDEQIHEAILQTLDDMLILESVTTSLDVLETPLTRKALTQYQTALNEDARLGRYKVRDFSEIKLRFRNFTAGVAGIALEYIDDSYYADSETHESLTEPTKEIRRYVLAVEKIDKRWKIVAFFEPARKPAAEQLKDSTTTSIPEAVDKISEDLGYQ